MNGFCPSGTRDYDAKWFGYTFQYQRLLHVATNGPITNMLIFLMDVYNGANSRT